jgi:AraC-like DNA-binding protein
MSTTDDVVYADLDDDFVPDEPKKNWTLPELRKFDGQLFIQNNTSNYLTFHEKMGDKSVDFELEPIGDPQFPNPDSIAFLPRLALDMRGLQKLWMKGAVTISTDPDMEDKIMLANARAVGASEQRLRELMGQQTESNTNAQMVEEMCKVCGRRNPMTQVIERGRVIQSRRQVKEGVVPLCPEHLDQASFFVPRLVADSKGEEHWEFDSMKIQAIQR